MNPVIAKDSQDNGSSMKDHHWTCLGLIILVQGAMMTGDHLLRLRETSKGRVKSLHENLVYWGVESRTLLTLPTPLSPFPGWQYGQRLKQVSGIQNSLAFSNNEITDNAAK